MLQAFVTGTYIVMYCSEFFSSVLPCIESLFFLMLCIELKDIGLMGNVLIGKELLAVPPYPPITLLHIPYILSNDNTKEQTTYIITLKKKLSSIIILYIK